MQLHFSADIEKLIRDHMATGLYSSEEELLVLALHALDENEAKRAAIEEGLASVDRGDAGVTLSDAFQHLRDKYLVSAEQQRGQFLTFIAEMESSPTNDAGSGFSNRAHDESIYGGSN